MTGVICEVLKDFQTAIVGVVGFAGVILTLSANACLTRRQHEREQAGRRRVVETGLHEELGAFPGMVERNLEHIDSIKDNDRSDLNILRVRPIVSDHLILDVGMLERNRAQAALRGVMTVHELNRKLVLFAGWNIGRLHPCEKGKDRLSDSGVPKRIAWTA